MFTKESLDLLRQRIDLVEVLSAHFTLARAGSAFKARCPFHEEKTPSFIVHKGDSHYHCFGCGAHGDAIAFLMTYVKMSFVDAVESLAERFHVTLERASTLQQLQCPNKAQLKKALEATAVFYHYLLLHWEEGRRPLTYLYERGLDLDFLRRFHIGYAPSRGDILWPYLHAQGIDEKIAIEAGIFRVNSEGKRKDFFSDRIIFPIRDAMGAVIGFSARKFKEETFGGKYINTSETPLFKKSRVLFGLSDSRVRIAKEKQALIVEGQIDCLRLIMLGWDYTIAAQGTAFGQEHVQELLNLGVTKVYLALDGDRAGQEAVIKIGHLFQKKGVEVVVVPLPEGMDPDSVLLQQGPEYFSKLMAQSHPYLPFVYAHLSRNRDLSSPSQKNALVSSMVETIRQWEMPVMVHESLRQLAALAQVPEEVVGVGKIAVSEPLSKTEKVLSHDAVDPHRILEADFLRWLIFSASQYPKLIAIAKANVQKEHFYIPCAYRLYHVFLDMGEEQRPLDLLSLSNCLDTEEDHAFLNEIMQRKVNLLRAEEGFKDTVHKILLRRWMEEREAIRRQLQSALLSEEEALSLVKQFDQMKNQVPSVIEPL